MKTAYYTVDGEIIGESTNGVRLDYLTDSLGSVTAKVDQTSSVTATARYKPYGDKLIGGTFTFGWIGALGYRSVPTGSYVRARHYGNVNGLWSSIDGFWPVQTPYNYSRANPTNATDSDGYEPTVINRSVTTFPNGTTGIKYNNCGGMQLDWSFTITPRLTGWLIQEVTHSISWHLCGGKAPEPCDPFYYEVWKVINGQVLQPTTYPPYWAPPNPQYPKDDTWVLPSLGPCTHGSHSIHGRLQFVQEDKLPDDQWLQQWGFIRGKVPCASALPSATNLNKTFEPSATGDGFMSVNWGCCKKPKKCLLPPNPDCNDACRPGACFVDITYHRP